MRTLRQIIGEAIGEASVQWEPEPSGVFQSDSASALISRTLAEVEEATKAQLEEARAVLREVEWVDDVCPACDGVNPEYAARSSAMVIQIGHTHDCRLARVLSE